MGKRGRDAHRRSTPSGEQHNSAPAAVAPVDARPTLRAPDGRVFRETTAALDPAAAQELVAAGATVAWDSCGCRGYCGMEWFDRADNALFLRTGSPQFVAPSRKVPHATGHLSAWRTDDGQVLVLASREVRWGGLLF